MLHFFLYMANKSSALKKTRHDSKIKAQNKIIKKSLKKVIKKADGKNFPKLQKAIDKAAKKGIIKKNKAARIKSRLAKKAILQKTHKPASSKSKA